MYKITITVTHFSCIVFCFLFQFMEDGVLGPTGLRAVVHVDKEQLGDSVHVRTPDRHYRVMSALVILRTMPCVL